MGIRVDVQSTLKLGEVTDGILIRLVGGQNKAAERLLALASARAPLDDGTLVASGQVNPATDAEEDAEVIFDTPYAARWHEDGPLVDNLGRRYAGNSNFQNGRSSKYLEGPARENRDELRDIIETEARRG